MTAHAPKRIPSMSDVGDFSPTDVEGRNSRFSLNRQFLFDGTLVPMCRLVFPNAIARWDFNCRPSAMVSFSRLAFTH